MTPDGMGTKVRAEPDCAAATESIDSRGVASLAAGGGTCAGRCEESGWCSAPAARMAHTQLERSTSVSARSESTRSRVSNLKRKLKLALSPPSTLTRLPAHGSSPDGAFLAAGKASCAFL